MLVLSRKIGESLVIDGEITIKVSQIQGNRVKLCIDAPRTHRVVRAEIQPEEVSAVSPLAASPLAAGRSSARLESTAVLTTHAK